MGGSSGSESSYSYAKTDGSTTEKRGAGCGGGSGASSSAASAPARLGMLARGVSLAQQSNAHTCVSGNEASMSSEAVAGELSPPPSATVPAPNAPQRPLKLCIKKRKQPPNTSAPDVDAELESFRLDNADTSAEKHDVGAIAKAAKP